MSEHNWEDKFRSWSSPPSQSETDRISNTERAIRRALNASPKLSHRTTRIFIQGSYRNNVNVRQDSDIDVGILCTDTFLWNDKSKRSAEKLNISPATYHYDTFRAEVGEALRDYFGSGTVTDGGTAFDIKSNTYRVDADVAAFFEHRRYDENGSYIEGVEMRPPKAPHGIINWPEQHYSNGTTKNNLTTTRYKRMVRVLKKLMFEMQAEGIDPANKVSGFLIECLVWNVPNNHFGKPSYYSDLRDILIFLYQHCSENSKHSEWGEVSELKYLFRPNQKWTAQDAVSFLNAAWNFVGY